jgi:hypothetical protein
MNPDRIKECIKDLMVHEGLPPHNNSDNFCDGDVYFGLSIKHKYSESEREFARKTIILPLVKDWVAVQKRFKKKWDRRIKETLQAITEGDA